MAGLAVGFIGLAVGPVLRGQDSPVGVPVHFAGFATKTGTPGEPGEMTLHADVLASPDIPSGSLDLSGAALTGGFHLTPTSDPTHPEKQIARLEPGKLYAVTITRGFISDLNIDVTPPSGYQVEIADNSSVTTIRSRYTVAGTNPSTDLTLFVRVSAPQNQIRARAGVATSIASGRIFWQVALGGLKNGGSAGSLGVIDAGTSSTWTSIFTPAGLQYEAPATEISVYRENGDIRQILANEACVDVVTLSSNSYELRFFHYSQMQGSSNPRSFNGFPYVTYRIEQVGTGSKLKITSETRDLNGTFSTNAPSTTVIGVTDSNAPIARTAATTLERTGSSPGYSWDLQDWNTVGQTQQVQDERTWGGTTSARTESAAVSVPSGATALQLSRSFTLYNWGEAATQQIVGSSNTVTTDYDYYGDAAYPESYGAIRSISSTGGAWQAYEYDSAGAVSRLHRPFQNLPSSVPSDLASSTSGEITAYTYSDDAFGRANRPATIVTQVNGTTTASANITYTDTSVVNNMYVVVATRTDQTDSNSSHLLTTTTKYYREDTLDDFFRGQLHSIQRPDGTKQSFAYQHGSWSGSAFTKSSNNGLDSGPASRSVVIAGSATTGSSLSSYDGYTIDTVYLVANKSTMQVTIRDSLAHVVHTETQAWSGSAWVVVASTDYNSYDWSNQLTGSQASNGALYSAQFSGEQKQWEQGPTGTKITCAYDYAGRVDTTTQDGTTAVGALVTKYVYDAADRVTTQTVGYGQSGPLVSSHTYDDAGRVTSDSRPGPNGAITTSYSYSPSSRQVTITLPNGGSRVETYQPDGSLYSVTGSGVVPEYYTYDVQSGGVRYAKVNIGSSGSSRLREGWSDWLGRTTQTSHPGFTGQSAFVETAVFDNTGTGRLTKTTRTGYANTLYEYDALSQLTRSGLDIGGTTDALDLSSSDRIADSDQYFENYSSAWWLTKLAKTYPTASSSTALTVSTTRQRLTGFSGSVQAETLATDADGNTTDRVTTVDRTNKTVTITTTTSGISNAATQIVDNGLTTSTTGFDGITYTTGYDGLHRPTTRTDPRSTNSGHIVSTTSYMSGSAFVYRVLDGAGNYTATYTYDNAGRVVAVMDANSKFTYTSYNTLDQVVHRWGDSAYPVEYGYDSTYADRTSMKTYRGGSGWTGSSWTGSPGTADQTTWTYDTPSGLLASKTDAPTTAHPSGKTVSYTYNARGQTAVRTWARGVTTTYGYDSLTGELLTQTYSDGTPTVTFTYTRAGQVNTVADVTGTRSFVYNGTDPLQLDALDLPAYYGSRILTRQYDGIHRPDGFLLGTTGNLSGDLTQTYTYATTTGQFDHVTGASAVQSSREWDYSYNTGGLISSLAVASSSFSVSYAYEPNRDLLTSIDSKWSTTSRTKYDYTYNTLAQRDSRTQTGDVFGDYVGSGYTGAIYQNDVYNARGELIDAADYLGTSTSGAQLSGRHHAYTYDNLGNRLTASRTGTAGAPDDYTTNALNQYESKENNVAHTAGTVASSSVTVTAGGTNGASVSGVGRQGRYWDAQAVLANSGGPSVSTLTITATLAGGGSGGADLVRTDTRTAMIAKSLQAFAYDDDGNLTTDGVWNYAYDAENRLIQMTTTTTAVSAGFPDRTIENKYDYLGRRVQKRSATASTDVYHRFLYDGDNLVAEFNAPSGTSCGSLLKSYTWGLDLAGSLDATGGVGALLQITDHSTSTSYYPTYDGNGNVASLIQTDTVGAISAGTAVAKYEYSPFGELLRCEGSYAASNPFRFSTKFTDDETGLINYGARFYSPSLGRFINRDPIEEAGGLNLYGFCGNDAINGYDYLGYNFWGSITKAFHQVVNAVYDAAKWVVSVAIPAVIATAAVAVAAYFDLVTLDNLQAGVRLWATVFAATAGPAHRLVFGGGGSGGGSGSPGSPLVMNYYGDAPNTRDYGEIRAVRDPVGDRIPLTAKNLGAVILDGLGKFIIGASLIGSDQMESPDVQRSRIVGTGYGILRTDIGDRLGIDVNNPRFQVASDMAAIVGGYILMGQASRIGGDYIGAPKAVNISTEGLSAIERNAIIEYARRSNQWLKENGPVNIQSTKGTLRSQASAAARVERLRAARTGTPYQGQAGHVPDTAITGQPKPPGGWLDMPGISNNVAGGVLGNIIGEPVEVITVDGVVHR